MVENHVSAFFYGHDHEYAHQARDGVVYQLVPAPSMTGNGFDLYHESDPHTIKVLPNSGHLRVTISKPGTQPKLDWPAASVDHYAVYRSQTAPYFAPPSAGTKLGNVATADHTYTDSTADLTVAGSYYYVVASMSAGDAPVGASSRTGVFVFGVAPSSGP